MPEKNMSWYERRKENDKFAGERELKMFETNQNTPERVLRFLVSVVLLPAPFVISGNEPYTFTAAAIGGILLFNALSGVCMTYKLFGVNTCKLP